jgi:hypothetical protein
LDLTLPGGAEKAVSSSPGSIVVDSGRFVTITGTFPLEGDFKGLLWCDTAKKVPAMIFVLMMQNLGIDNNSSGSLDIYSNGKGAIPGLPPQLIASILNWEKDTKVTTITQLTVHNAQNQSSSMSPSALNIQ